MEKKATDTKDQRETKRPRKENGQKTGTPVSYTSVDKSKYGQEKFKE